MLYNIKDDPDWYEITKLRASLYKKSDSFAWVEASSRESLFNTQNNN